MVNCLRHLLSDFTTLHLQDEASITPTSEDPSVARFEEIRCLVCSILSHNGFFDSNFRNAFVEKIFFFLSGCTGEDLSTYKKDCVAFKELKIKSDTAAAEFYRYQKTPVLWYDPNQAASLDTKRQEANGEVIAFELKRITKKYPRSMQNIFQ